MHVVSGRCLSEVRRSLRDRRIDAWIVSGWGEYWDVALEWPPKRR